MASTKDYYVFNTKFEDLGLGQLIYYSNHECLSPHDLQRIKDLEDDGVFQRDCNNPGLFFMKDPAGRELWLQWHMLMEFEQNVSNFITVSEEVSDRVRDYMYRYHVKKQSPEIADLTTALEYMTIEDCLHDDTNIEELERLIPRSCEVLYKWEQQVGCGMQKLLFKLVYHQSDNLESFRIDLVINYAGFLDKQSVRSQQVILPINAFSEFCERVFPCIGLYVDCVNFNFSYFVDTDFGNSFYLSEGLDKYNRNQGKKTFYKYNRLKYYEK